MRQIVIVAALLAGCGQAKQQTWEGDAAVGNGPTEQQGPLDSAFLFRDSAVLFIARQELLSASFYGAPLDSHSTGSYLSFVSDQLKPLSSYVAFVNDGTVPVRQIIATDGDRTYRIGSLTVEELLSDIIKTDPIRDIYNYLSPAVSHKCSNGSHLLDEFLGESVLQRLYSYSFGCCSDVNEPMLSSLYMAAGFEGRSLRSQFHVGIDVCDHQGLCYYADVDRDLFFVGGIEVARASHSRLADWLADDILYKENGELRPLAAEGEKIAPIEFNFYPGDWIAFSPDPATNPVLRRYPGDIPDVPPETAEGVALIRLSNYEIRREGACTAYQVRFPYVLLSATAYETLEQDTVELPGHGKYQLDFELCDVSSSAVLSVRFQYNRNILPNPDTLTAGGVTVLRHTDRSLR